jgi:mRNA interferase MazF
VNVRRGEIVMAVAPYASDPRNKRRPVLVVLNDRDNARLQNTVVAVITSNLRRRHDSSHYLIEIATPDGQQSGLFRDSLVSCNNLLTIRRDHIDRLVGSLSPQAMQQVDQCLRAALDLP